MIKSDNMVNPNSEMRFGMGIAFSESYLGARGEFFVEMTDKDGNTTISFSKKNVITYDAGILAARLCKNPAEPAHGFNMLAVGTGATGNILSPDAPDRRQRKLNSEIERKGFSSSTFRNVSGVAVGYPTNIVDFTTIFGPSEAIGPLTEMGIVSTISDNPSILNPNPNSFPTRDTTIDISIYDVLCNYLTFPVISKPAGSNLTITWRITFG